MHAVLLFSCVVKKAAVARHDIISLKAEVLACSGRGRTSEGRISERLFARLLRITFRHDMRTTVAAAKGHIYVT
jgi:hypothetical protein